MPSLTQQRPERVFSDRSTGYLEHGLVAVERLYIEPTDDHIGSTVVVLGQEE